MKGVLGGFNSRITCRCLCSVVGTTSPTFSAWKARVAYSVKSVFASSSHVFDSTWSKGIGFFNWQERSALDSTWGLAIAYHP